MRLMTRMKCKLLEAEIKVLQFRMLNRHYQHLLPLATKVTDTYRQLLLMEQARRVAANMGMN
jgi:hypothetical protein